MKLKKLISAALFLCLTISLYAQSLIKLKASQEEYFDKDEEAVLLPSQNGIYPVRLTVSVESNDKTLYIKIYRSETINGNYSLVIDYMLPNQEYFDLFDSEPMQPGKKYYYIAVLGKQDLQTASPEHKSNKACGWGSLTQEAFYVFFNNTLSKSYPKMTLMNKPNALNKLGTEETKGDKSGQFLYEAKIKGMGGYAVMSYKNYSDDDLVYFTGDMITNADMFSSGKMEGSVRMTGMYNGTVGFSNVEIKNSKANAGTYSVKPDGAELKEIDYTWNFVVY